MDGTLLTTPRNPYLVVDPATSSPERRRRQDVAQFVANREGYFHASLYLPQDTDPGTHIVTIQDFGTPRRTVWIELEVVGDGEELIQKGKRHAAEDAQPHPEGRSPQNLYVGPDRTTAETHKDDGTGSIYRLAPSSWPTVYHDAHLTKLMDINHNWKNDDAAGPHVHKEAHGAIYSVKLKWKIPTGMCISNVSQGTDGSLYYAVTGTNKLLKINPNDGTILTFHQVEGSTLVNQPMILQENGLDRIYLPVTGAMLKFDSNLILLQTSPPLVWMNPFPSQTPQSTTLLGAVCTFSNLTSSIIFVAQGTQDKAMTAGTVLYSLSPDNLEILDAVDIVQDIYSEFQDVEPDNYPTYIRSNNTASIGPVFNTDGSLSNEELVFVLLQNNYLLAYRLGVDAEGRSQFRGRKWPEITEEWLRADSFPSINSTTSGYYFNRQAGTSPTISPDGRRVYICSGAWDPNNQVVPTAIYSPQVKPRLYAYDTQNGTPYWAEIPDRYYYFASDTSDVPEPPPPPEPPANEPYLLDGKVISSPSCTFDVERNTTMVYIVVKDGGVYGYADSGTSLKIQFGTNKEYTFYGMNSAVAGKFYYGPFYIGDAREKCYAGAVNTISTSCSSADDCATQGARPDWQYLLDSDDICIRTVTQSLDGKTQVYFGTLTTLYCFEEKRRPVSQSPHLPFRTEVEVRTWRDQT